MSVGWDIKNQTNRTDRSFGNNGRTGPCSTACKVSDYRCVSDCRSRVASLIPARSHTLVEINHVIISMVILLPSADSFKKVCC